MEKRQRNKNVFFWVLKNYKKYKTLTMYAKIHVQIYLLIGHKILNYIFEYIFSYINHLNHKMHNVNHNKVDLHFYTREVEQEQ